MIRQIIHIDESRCNGCGLCARACHEGAIDIVKGKAKLVREHFCDGFGDCLPKCPMDAITFEMREAPAYNEAAVKEAKEKALAVKPEAVGPANWPVQIKLAPLKSPYFSGAELLIAADCTAYAYGRFHEDFIKGKTTLIGCTKLDNTDYSEKLGLIISNNDIKSVTVVKMEVPCCSGLEAVARKALEESGKDLPLEVVTIGIDGSIWN